MIIEKAAAIPLITCDPDFSIWSTYVELYNGSTTHWSKCKNSMNGYIKIDDETYCFLGNSKFGKVIEQKYIDVTVTSSLYVFENKKVVLKVKFTTPLLLENPYIASRPVSYIDFFVEKKKECKAKIIFTAEANIVRNDTGAVEGLKGKREGLNYSMMGKIDQRPLSQSGDRIKINWGYLYLASKHGETEFDNESEMLVSKLDFDRNNSCSLIIAYDDLVSINYMGDMLKGMWTKKYKTMLNAIVKAENEHDELILKCQKLDEEIEEKAMKSGGKDYVFLCNMSYRQAISAHKIVETKNGEMLVLSKENDSNGCIGTADVSYPSIPIFMLYGVKYIKGLIRPIMDFADCEVWEYDYAPHDVGRYPYAWGQAYALKNKNEKHDIKEKFEILPPTYLFPKGNDVYDENYQMPIEECGNMLIMTANVCLIEKSADFAVKYEKHLSKWCEYLMKYGANPGNQLCTDDFAGHLANNVNLSFKAVMGIEAYALIKKLDGKDVEYKKYHEVARQMAADCEKRAIEGNHTRLTYDKEGTWGLKYNIVWDKIWKTNLFTKEIFEKETDYYISKSNDYGVPLDNRADYTKSDWILWCSALTEDKEKREKLTKPVANFLKNTTSRVAFSDWYDTISGEYKSFIARSVQGGIFMPIIADDIAKID